MRLRIFAIPPALLVLTPGLLTQTKPTGLSSALLSNDSTARPAIIAMTLSKRVQEVNLILSVTDQKGHFV